MKRLAIVVPFRAREVHLRVFVPALRAYFTRDKIDREIPYSVLIVEQATDLPFNRGALKNIGFALCSGESDYVCFHDVDYLPIWADYSWSAVPSCIVWYGAEQRPLRPGRSELIVNHDLDEFCGGAVLMPNSIFAKVNGYANSYWGWGFEDGDLRNRLAMSGIEFGRRKGTFQALAHDNEGFRLDPMMRPVLTQMALINFQTCNARWSTNGDNKMQVDGLKNLSYEIVNRQPIPDTPDQRPAVWEKVTVKLLMRPSPEHLKAHGTGVPN
jgi:N-terminal region of glycosyl transferase group 7/N-terminal domain of galactosyltransferase